MVGGQGAGNGGGGGSFVTDNTNNPLIIAGGGGGSGSVDDNVQKRGQAGTTGGNGAGGSGGAGGANGTGGIGATGFGQAGGGGGLLTNGGTAENGSGVNTGGRAFVNGGVGLPDNNGSDGGFGGGGNGSGTNSGGGGGGYSGGGGGGAGVGGGGGSYNAGTDQINTAGANSGNGVVIISTPCTPFTATLSSSGTLTCAQTSVKLTAGGGLDGATYVFSAQAQNTSPTSATATATMGIPYSVTVTNPGGCSSTATTTVMSNTAVPTVSITPSATAICAGQTATFTASGSPASYSWSSGQTTAMISASVQGPYSVTATSNSNGCRNSATAMLTVNPLPTPTIVGLSSAYCKDAGPVTLTGSPSGGAFTIDGNPATTFNPASLSVGQHTVVYSYTNANGCSNTASKMVTVNALPDAPAITTQSGHSYPAGVSSLTISQNTGPVILMTSGCAGGTITWSGGNSNTLSVATTNTGTQTFTATCTANSTGCTSPLATATVTVVAPTLKVFSRDPDNGQLNNNTIKPYLLLQNVGTTPINYSTITVRYYLTTENNIPLLFQKNYVAIGQNNVQLRYVQLATPVQGATGYIEYSFSPGAGNLNPNSDSGPIETQINKQDYSAFNQLDDYSYINNSAYTLNPRITAYKNGVIFYGTEPGSGSPRLAAEEVGTVLSVRVLGNPVTGSTAQVEISGVEGQRVNLSLTDLQGRSMHQQRIDQAGVIERVSVPVDGAPGILLLQVATPTQRQQIKLVKP